RRAPTAAGLCRGTLTDVGSLPRPLSTWGKGTVRRARNRRPEYAASARVDLADPQLRGLVAGRAAYAEPHVVVAGPLVSNRHHGIEMDRVVVAVLGADGIEQV